jgi:MtN3 and saliva related transmembrane protein
VRGTLTTLGLISGTFTTLSFLPQVLRTLRTRSAADFSFGWLSLFGAGVSGWLAYGLLSADLAISLSNALTLALVLVLVGLKVLSSRPARS